MPGISSAHQQYLKRQKHRHYLIRITQFSLFFLFMVSYSKIASLSRAVRIISFTNGL